MKKPLIIFAMLCWMMVPCMAQESKSLPKMEWWQDAKFGLFLHWGLYSVAAGDWNGHPYKGNEHFMLYEKIPWKTYAQIANRFNPTVFNAEEWVKMAKAAGMKYIVITTKHHDGFAMFDSKSSDYNIVKRTPWGKDPLKALAAACKKMDMKLGFYYSLGRDWQDPDVPTNWPVKAGRSNTWDYPNEDAKDFSRYFERKVKPQIKELLTQYGPVAVLWFDTPELIQKQQSKELEDLIHQLQPQCIINSRIGNGLGDFKVAEQSINGKIQNQPWEACITMSGGWGYSKYDSVWKSPDILIRQLTEVVSKGGNYLLNIGPMGNGAFPKPAMERLQIIGQWMQTNHEAIYGVKSWKVAGYPLNNVPTENKSGKKDKDQIMTDVLNDNTSKAIFPEIRFAIKGDVLYLFANNISNPELKIEVLGGGKEKKIKQIECLGYPNKITWKQGADALYLEKPPIKRKLNLWVYRIRFEN